MKYVKLALAFLQRYPFAPISWMGMIGAAYVFINILRSNRPYDERTYYLILAMATFYFSNLMGKIGDDNPEDAPRVDNKDTKDGEK